jgi:hypothetical protein
MLQTLNQKNSIYNFYIRFKDDTSALFLGNYPHFIYRKIPSVPKEIIPVFTFHYVEPGRFEAQMKYLAENNYKTLTADEFYNIISGRIEPIENAVLLTFDDGRGSLWSVAYPLLKKYGLHAVNFIIPHTIKEGNLRNPNLEDYWEGKASLEEIIKRDEQIPFCTWNEIIEMQKSGVVDSQSHSFYHCSVFVNNKLVDFVNPDFQPTLLNGNLHPLIRKNGIDFVPDIPDLGFPVYNWAANMETDVRYLENEKVSEDCVNFVMSNGGALFFNQSGWRKILENFFQESKKKHSNGSRFQTPEERKEDIRKDILLSKNMLEKKLDKPVLHLAFPWFAGSDLAVEISKEEGFVCNYWGIKGRKAINKVGDDPYYIRRLNDIYIFSLPGKDRTPLSKLLSFKLKKTIKGER